MDRRAFTPKRMVAIVAVAALTIAVALFAPPVSRIAIALVALPLTAMLAASIAGGSEPTLTRS